MFSKTKRFKFLAVLLLVLIFALPSAAKETSGRSGSTSAKSSVRSSAKKESKSGTKKRGGKKKRRSRACYTSSHESEEQKKKIAAETKRLEENPDLSGDIPELAEDQLVWPVKYGYISRGVCGRHSGVDMMSRAGDPVYAVADGVVEFIAINSAKYSGYGKMAVIRHDGKKLWSLYSHCSEIYLNVGQEVKRGQKIASVGRTGRATCNHLHFELRGENKKLLNPLEYLPEEGALGKKYVPH